MTKATQAVETTDTEAATSKPKATKATEATSPVRKAVKVGTVSTKPADAARDRQWLIIDASDKILGRLASAIAYRLRGKHKPEYTPHVDTGDHVIVINTAGLKVTGNKAQDKIYYSHSGFPGGLKKINFAKLFAKSPEKVLERAIRGMLPKGPLGRAMFKKLKVYSGPEHPHESQQPQKFDI